MKIVNITILISCILSSLTCSAMKYQIKVLNTPKITIDKKEAKVGDWFNDESVITWSRDNQAMRVVSEDNKVYTLSAKLYKESNSKKFPDFIAYTKPLAARGTKDLDLIEQLTERFDNYFVMLDEIVIDLSDLDLPEEFCFQFSGKDDEGKGFEFEIIPDNKILQISRNYFTEDSKYNCKQRILSVKYYSSVKQSEEITNSFEIEIVPFLLEDKL